jgi:hypothetical protein
VKRLAIGFIAVCLSAAIVLGVAWALEEPA